MGFKGSGTTVLFENILQSRTTGEHANASVWHTLASMATLTTQLQDGCTTAAKD